MYTKQSKKMLPLNILEILQKYTDENHTLSQKEIEKHLADKYDMVVDRRSVKRGIMDLIDMGFEIHFTEIARTVKDKKTGEIDEQSIMTDFYLEREFSKCEIRLLIDELIDSDFIPTRQRKQLISKLEGLSSIYFRKNRVGGACYKEVNNQLFYTLEIIEEAISKNMKVRFTYQKYSLDKRGKICNTGAECFILPIETRKNEGHYYVIGIDGIGKEQSFRMDQISDIEILEESWRDRIPVQKYEKERKVVFLASESIVPLFIDIFGIEISTEYRADGVEISVNTTEKKAIDFAIRYSASATVLYPVAYRDRVKEVLREGLERYA